ncbi:MAG TPA: histidinol dehydrogenase, partial [Gemmatales bacterium]|nr:histidinol dehydrogenase [Gemmatales bacterium]
MSINIRIIDCTTQQASQFLAQLRQQLSPDGDLVPASGQALTRQVFGEALTPNQSVERICQAVRREGFAAAQQFSQAFDRFALTESNLRVSDAELQEAHRQARPELLQAIR